jgi:hypothetical protein
MLQIPSQLTLQSIEDSLSALVRAPDQKTIWPLHVRGIALGGEAALVQLLITWSLLARSPSLNLAVPTLTSEHVDDFIQQLHGFAASLLADSALDTSGRDHQPFLRDAALLKLYQLDGPAPRDALRRLHNFTILCADHFGRSTPRLLYYSSTERAPLVRNEKEFRLFANWVLRSVIPERFRRLPSADGDVIGSMLHEIFENTEDHATRDLNNNVLRKSLRGFFARHHWLSDHEADTLTDGFPALRRFCHAIPSRGSRKQLIEISVFDSGPGFAQRLTNMRLAALSTKKEFEAVSDCFRGKVTTKTHAGHGIGLKYVVRLLRQKGGFLRLRTGRLSLFADLSGNESISSDEPPALRDAGDGEITRRGQMQGSLISLLIPLHRT